MATICQRPGRGMKQILPSSPWKELACHTRCLQNCEMTRLFFHSCLRCFATATPASKYRVGRGLRSDCQGGRCWLRG